MQQQQIQQLIEKVLQRRATDAEYLQLMNALKSASADAVTEEINKMLDSDLLQGEAAYDHHYWNNIAVSILQADKITHGPRIVHRVHFLRTAWFRYAAAALLLFGTGAYLWNNSKTKTANSDVANIQAADSIGAGQNTATLTLSDGRQIKLNDSAVNTFSDSNAVIQNVNGGLLYAGNKKSVNGNRPVYNTMSTPRGGQYQLTLADGTKVWLNAASSITFPTAFKGPIREVTVTGEAYFEISQNKNKPFIVKAMHEKITVLGTSFNVNAYPNEKAVKISLAEGAVKIKEKILKPGQAYLDGTIAATNLSQDLAWKDGVFDFNNANLVAVMRQLERWYDIEVKYVNGVPDAEFAGRMSRSLNLPDVIEFLKGSKLNIRAEGRIITIIND